MGKYSVTKKNPSGILGHPNTRDTGLHPTEKSKAWFKTPTPALTYHIEKKTNETLTLLFLNKVENTTAKLQGCLLIHLLLGFGCLRSFMEYDIWDPSQD